jgi:hypothetical protein
MARIFVAALGPEHGHQRFTGYAALDREVDEECGTQALAGQALQLDTITKGA